MILHPTNRQRRCKDCGAPVVWPSLMVFHLMSCPGEPKPIALDVVLARSHPFTAREIARLRVALELPAAHLKVALRWAMARGISDLDVVAVELEPFVFAGRLP